MKSYVKIFDYPHEDVMVRREVLILNEDEKRIGGIELNSLSDEQKRKVIQDFSEVQVTDFSRKKRVDKNGNPVEKKVIDTFGAPYKAYSRAKL